MKLIRSFHPIGQGAYYSEQCDHFLVVYDCGEWKNSKRADAVVAQSRRKEDVVDILFISHFDYDHVNKIKKLMSSCKRIKKVIMPLLHNDEKLILSNLYNNKGEDDLALLVNDPKEYFGKDTIIIQVPEADDGMYQEGNFRAGEQKIELVKKDMEIQCGTKIINGMNDWIFIPYNFRNKERREKLIEIFQKKGLDFERFKNDSEYRDLNRKKIAEAYDKIDGGINQNSMFVYSGPNIIRNDYKYNTYRRYYWRYLNDKPGCIYTGDGDLNTVIIKSIFKNHWDNVGTIQIPHHGAINCFNKDFLEKDRYACPISVGTNNTYGHPSSSVIAEIDSKFCLPVVVDEKLLGGYSEIIEKENTAN